MQTIQCPRCSHTFLSYAAECPECGLRRPNIGRSKCGLVALVASGITLAATGMMVRSILHTENEPVMEKQPSSQVLPRPAVAARAATRPAIVQTASRGLGR